MSEQPAAYGTTRERGPTVSYAEIERAARSLMAAGEPPTVEAGRKALGRGSPNQIATCMQKFWKNQAALNAGDPIALTRLPPELADAAVAQRERALRLAQQTASYEDNAARAHLEQLREQLATVIARTIVKHRARPRSYAPQPHPPLRHSLCGPAGALRGGRRGNDEWSTVPGRAFRVQYDDVHERWNVRTPTTGSPCTGPRRAGARARARGTGPPRGDCRSQYSVCRPRRPMDTVGGRRATDRANRPGAPEMPSNIMRPTRNRMTPLLAP